MSARARDFRTDPFAGVFPVDEHGRARGTRRGKPGEPGAFESIASDCAQRPEDPARVTELVAELRDHWGHKLGGPATDTALARYAVASLVAGAQAGIAQTHTRTRAGRRRDQARAGVDAVVSEHLIPFVLALARARVLYAELVSDNYEAGAKVLDSHGANKGFLRRAALACHRSLLARDRELLADDARPDPPPPAA